MTIYNVLSRDMEALVQDVSAHRVSEANAWALAAELRRVLEMVEWATENISEYQCPWCMGWKHEGHASDCPRQLVLFPPEPEPGG